MKQLSTLLALGAALLLALGCDNRTDPIMLMDSGPPDAGPMCGEALPPPTEAACAMSTATCLNGCGNDGTCIQNCFQADPNAQACIGCFNIAILSCSSRTDCMAEYMPLDCCVVANCDPNDPNAPCIGAGGPCETEYNTFDTCTMNASLSDCTGVANVCFPPAGGLLPGLTHGIGQRPVRDLLPALNRDASWIRYHR